GRGDRAEAGANLCPGQPAPQPESGAGDVGAGDLESWPTKRLWKRRAGEKSNSRLSPRACKSRKKRAIRTFPQPRRRPFSGYIFHVSTAQPKVTFSNGLTRWGLGGSAKVNDAECSPPARPARRSPARSLPAAAADPSPTAARTAKRDSEQCPGTAWPPG